MSRPIREAISRVLTPVRTPEVPIIFSFTQESLKE